MCLQYCLHLHAHDIHIGHVLHLFSKLIVTRCPYTVSRVAQTMRTNQMVFDTFRYAATGMGLLLVHPH